LFGELVKKGNEMGDACYLGTYLASLDFASALVAFAAGTAPAVRPVVDYIIRRRDIKRRNSMSYLIGISGEDPDDR